MRKKCHSHIPQYLTVKICREIVSFLPFLDVELLNCDNNTVTYIGRVNNLGLDSLFNLCIVISPNRWSKNIQISADDGKLQLELNLVAVVILALV